MDSTATCVTCKREITAETKGIQCGQCRKIFHSTCTLFTTVLTTTNEKIKACRPFITAVNTPNLQTRLRGSKSGTNSPVPSSDGSERSSMDRMLETICGKLDKLEKLDSIEKTTASFESRFTEVERKLDELNVKAAALDQLPELLSRMTSMETRMRNSESKIENIEREQLNLRLLFDEVAVKANSAGGAEASSRLDTLDNESKVLRGEVQHLQLRLSSKLVISGLMTQTTTQENINLKRLTFATLKTLITELEPRDVVSARLLTKKGLNISSSSSPPFVVSLSSPALAREVLIAKIRKRKLHTAELDTNLIRNAGITSPIPSGLININEFLPKEIHELRNEVRKQAKLRDFVSFIRNGDIHVRRGNDSLSSIIVNQQQLANFLERI